MENNTGESGDNIVPHALGNPKVIDMRSLDSRSLRMRKNGCGKHSWSKFKNNNFRISGRG
jgi:hypothetical protein